MSKKCEFSEFTYSYAFLRSLEQSFKLHPILQIGTAFLPLIPNLREEKHTGMDAFLVPKDNTNLNRFKNGITARTIEDHLSEDYQIDDSHLFPLAFQFKIPKLINYKPGSNPYIKYKTEQEHEDDLYSFSKPEYKKVYRCLIDREQNETLRTVSERLGIRAFYAAPNFVTYNEFSQYFWDFDIHHKSCITLPADANELDQNPNHHLYYLKNFNYPNIGSLNLEPEFYSKAIPAQKVEVKDLKSYAYENKVERKKFIQKVADLAGEGQFLDAVIVFLKYR